MKRIYLSGYVDRYELSAAKVKEYLDAAGGEEIEIHLNTQGGDISEGIAIYDLIDKYEGKKTCLMGGLVASIGSYIATACQKVVAQDITIYMIHNASTFIYGDYKDMLNGAEYLEKLNAHISDRLSRFSGKNKEEILSLMDEETWYYGREIMDAGFATDFLETGKAEQNASNVISIKKHEYHERLKSVAAYFGELPKPKEQKMTFDEFKNAAKDFIKSGEFTFDGAVDMFDAKNKLITEEQKATLNALGDNKPEELLEKVKQAERQALNAELDEAFGKDGLLREYADARIEAGKTVDEIREDKIAKKLAEERAAGLNVIVDENKKKETQDGGPIRVNY